MAETQSTTNAVLSMALNVAPLKTAGFLDESSGYPYAVTLTNITGFAVYNLSATNAVTFTITLEDAAVFTIPVPANTPFNTEFEDAIATINIAGTTPDFSAELQRRSI